MIELPDFNADTILLDKKKRLQAKREKLDNERAFLDSEINGINLELVKLSVNKTKRVRIPFHLELLITIPEENESFDIVTLAEAARTQAEEAIRGIESKNIAICTIGVDSK